MTDDALPLRKVPVNPGDLKCQHCFARTRVDALGTLRTLSPAGYLGADKCEGMPKVPHKLMPKVGTNA